MTAHQPGPRVGGDYHYVFRMDMTKFDGLEANFDNIATYLRTLVDSPAG